MPYNPDDNLSEDELYDILEAIDGQAVEVDDYEAEFIDNLLSNRWPLSDKRRAFILKMRDKYL